MNTTERWMHRMLSQGPTGWCCPHEPPNAQGQLDLTGPGPEVLFDAYTKSLYCDRLDCRTEGRTIKSSSGRVLPVLVAPEMDAIERFTCDHCRNYSGTVTDGLIRMGRLTFKAGLCRDCQEDITSAVVHQ